MFEKGDASVFIDRLADEKVLDEHLSADKEYLLVDLKTIVV